MSCSYFKSSTLTLLALPIEPAEVCPGRKSPSSLVPLRNVLHAHTPAPCALQLISSKTYYGAATHLGNEILSGSGVPYVGNTWPGIFGLAVEQVRE